MMSQAAFSPSADTVGETARPENVPAKFWDSATGQVRTDALLRAYRDLERRASSMVRVPGPQSGADEVGTFRRAVGVPPSPDQYSINASHPALASDPGVNQRLHQAGFTQEQAQMVYDLAHECLLPLINDLAASQDQASQIEHLKGHFGGEVQWQESARQIKAWGKANLPKAAYDALASTADGVKTMHRLMLSDEPSLGAAPSAGADGRTEEQLKKMINDPRYWKTKDPAFIAKVSDGFRRLYGE
ncbi:hypothetical protein CCC_00510 [Paramagnetospirillum magnetotacticum MS-1]|uniref:Uncharacterized protein n=1 Tax=Paramagnetospirillum magnetotacticum MS-1 TaxID=272627 RepID=A0A0C2YCH9_PARME|nr:hypothetical protein [Paramagnetospirillum magnetotacticum]KIL97449.1 hypothetical protein CCC_00510 [Paramagnetospirillum magnetotacticum MS-1]